MDVVRFHVEGRPATWETQGEDAWKERLYQQLPRPDLDGRETGIELDFHVASFLRNGQPFDVDNLCEPIFSVLISRLGWFRGRRPNVEWWAVTKTIRAAEGCSGTISARGSAPEASNPPAWDEIYAGVLPTSATSPDLANWALDLRRRRGVDWLPETCALELGFADANTNIAEITTGRVKPFVDCLWPWLGGSARSPADHCVHRLIVRKGVAGLPRGAVSVRLWDHGRRRGQPEVVAPRPTLARPAASFASFGTAPASRPSSAVRNPCRPDTAKWIVCQGAIDGKTVADVVRELERLRAGSGKNIRQYLADVRSENGLAVAIDGDRLVLRG